MKSKMKKVLFTAATFVALSFTISSCGDDCVDCTGITAAAGIGKLCKSHYLDLGYTAEEWSVEKADLISAGCK